MNLDINTIVAQAPYFMVVFIRISAFMAFVPFFENQNFLIQVRVGFAFLLSLLIFPTISFANWVIPNNVLGFALVVSQEILVGILMGLTFLILLFGLQLAGLTVGFQMAFSMANVVDPSFGENTNVLSVLLVMTGTLMVLALGIDHYLLLSLGKSFDLVVPGSITVTKKLITEMSVLVIKAFEIGFRLAAPAIILLLCIDVTLGLIGKTSTKMQIFFVGLPLKIAVGLFSMTLILGFVLSIWGKEAMKLPEYLLVFFKLMKV
jgi:flagellar biosynthetic protein FliR